MKKFLSVILVLTFIISIPVQTFTMSADSTTDAQEKWKTNNCYEYPLTPADPNWTNLSYFEQLEACDMPIDMLSNCSTEELADLVLEYPFLIDILAFDNTDLAIKHLIDTSNICKEFFARNDVTSVLFQKYDAINVDYKRLQNTSNVTAATDCGYVSELFLQTYFAHVASSLTDTQTKELSRIICEKHEAKKGICNDYSTSLLIYDWIQIENGAIPKNLIPESIEVELASEGTIFPARDIETESNQTRATSGFSSSGYRVGTNGGAVYTVGTYTLYGVTTNCYKYYSGDYTTTEAANLNNSFDLAHSSWSRIATCTKKYNCHSYTWINSSSNNVYWLNNPDAFANSNSFTFVGRGFNTSLSSGDKIIICAAIASDDGFGNYTYSVHSANVLSSSGSTRSKLGSYGVYTVPVDELVQFYNGFYYCIYR